MKLTAIRLAACTALAAATVAVSPAFAITNSTPTTAFQAVGQGVQVTPNWVLVAEHVAIAPGGTYSNGYGSWIVAATYAAPGSGNWPQDDIALMRLVPIGNASAPYLAVNGTAIADGSFSPIAVTLASAANAPGGARAYATTTISESAALIDPDDAGPQPPVSANWLLSHDSSTYVVNGDSGSGMFLGAVGDSSLLLGLASGQLDDGNGRPTGSGYVQPAAYRSWIDAVMAADTADGQLIQWTVGAVPEPASALMLALGAAALLATRRRA